MTPFLSNSLKALVTRTVTNGLPSVTSVLQHLVFKMSFHDVIFTAPSPSPGGDEKVILNFLRSPVNYSTGLCIAYSLQLTFFIKMRKLLSILTILRTFTSKLVQHYLVLVCFTLFLSLIFLYSPAAPLPQVGSLLGWSQQVAISFSRGSSQPRD